MFTLDNAISPKESFEIEKAISYLVIKYSESGHNPKPVVLHSLRIATALLEMGYDKGVVIAAVLHDIIEDTQVTPLQLKDEFGQDVLDLVTAVSYDESIIDSVKQYKDMYDRVMVHGKDAVVLKAVDIAVNSLYIQLVPDKEKQKELVAKGTYFLDLTQSYANEPAWQLLKKRNLEEIKKLL